MVAEIRPILTTNLFFYCCGVIVYCKISFFAIPVMSFYICNQDVLMTDIRLLWGTVEMFQKPDTV